MARIRAMIVDDSAVVRTYLSDLLTQGGIEVIATAADPLFALPKLRANPPDVLVLDVEMPRMDGVTFLRQLMAECPLPVVMCSTLTEAGCQTTLDALAAGAVAFVTKPRIGLKAFLEDRSNGLVDAVRSAASANLRALAGARVGTTPVASAAPRGTIAPPAPRVPRPALEPAAFQAAMHETTERVVALGLSTGGVQSIEVVLRGLDRTTPGIVVVQHMPEKFTATYAQRLDSLCEMEVLEARDGDRVMTGRVLIAPGGKHMRLRRSGAQYLVEVRDGPLVNHHRPSVDVLLRSVAQCAGRNALGVVMTGMGDDGAQGLLEMRQAGAATAAQDEESCVVWGMPKAAVALGAARDVVGLAGISEWIRQNAAAPVARAG